MTNQPDTTKPMTEEHLEQCRLAFKHSENFTKLRLLGQDCLTEIERLRKENQELRKDKERLDLINPMCSISAPLYENQKASKTWIIWGIENQNIREAIDASKVTTETKEEE